MLVYDALAQKQVDVTVVFSTDGRLEQYGLRVLEDDRAFFPDYACMGIVRQEALKRYPALRELFAAFARKITPTDMRRMNRLVDVDQRSPADVAAAFLRELKLPFPARN